MNVYDKLKVSAIVIFLSTVIFIFTFANIFSTSPFSIVKEAEGQPIEAIECDNYNFNINNVLGRNSINNENNNEVVTTDGSTTDSKSLGRFDNNNIVICENFNSNEQIVVEDVVDGNGDSSDNGGVRQQPLIDMDNGGINNKLDNCPTVSNPGEPNNDNDSIGNVCDSTLDTIHSINAQATISDFNFAAVGDWGNGVNTQNTINKIKLGNPELVLGLGDYAYETNLADINSWWNRFVSAGLAQKWYGALGNHDDDMIPAGDMNEYQNKFPNQDSWYFSFNYQNIHFLVIDTESTYTIGSPQYNFIKNDLSTANSNSNIKWKVVIFHKIMYSSNSSHSPISSLRDALHPLFDQYKVDLVIQAHNHNYQRIFPLKYAGVSAGDSPIITTTNTTNYKNPEGQIYLVVGTGGQGLYTLGSVKPYTVTQFNDFGHLNMDVVENGTKLVAKFINNAGTIKDTFTITKPNLISSPPAPTVEICNNGIDDDSDRLIDLQDPDCNVYHYEPFFTATGSNKLDVPDASNLRLSSFTVATWFKTTTNLVDEGVMVNKGGLGSESAGANQNYGIWFTPSETLRGGFETTSGTNNYVTSTNTYNDGKWHHGVVTFDNTNNIVRLFVDGVQISTLTTSSNPDNTGSQPLRIGANSRSLTEFFIGQLDEVGVWNRALTNSEITNLMNTGLFPLSGLVYSNSFGTSVIRNDVGIDVGAFFYPWYGKYRHWTDGGHNPPITWASNYLPNLFDSSTNFISDNLYSSSDTNVIKKQIQLMNDTGIEFGIVSWWGQNTYEDMVFNQIINDVHPSIGGNGYNKFRWAILYEDEGFGDPTLTEIVNDLNYIKQNYASSPYYLHVNGKPVIFVYNAAHSGSNPLDDVERWKQAKAQVPFYVVFKVDPLSLGANPTDMDSWYQYAPASKYFEQQQTFSAFVSPGFWKYHENVRLPAANPTEFDNAVSKLKQAQVTWKLVETWNEWGEGTGIEPAQQIIHDDINGFKLISNQPPSQQYMEIFKRYFK